MEPTVAELAEDADAHLLPRPGFETIHRDDFFFEAGQAPRVDAAAPPRRRRGSTSPGRATNAPAAGSTRCEWWVGWSATPADLARAAARSRLRPGRRGGDADRHEHRPRTACGAARRRAPDRDARAAARGARGRLGGLEPARGGASLAAGVRARALRPGTAASTTSPRTRTTRRSASAARSTWMHGVALMGGAVLPRLAGVASTARSSTRAGSTRSRAARRCSSCRRAACRRRCSTGSAFGATACSSCSSIP